jgi:thioredoxin-related protein
MDIFLWIVVLLQLVIVFLLSRFIVDFLNRIKLGGNLQYKSLQAGDNSPSLNHKNINGETVKLEEKTILAFVNSNCELCRYLVKVLSTQHYFIDYSVVFVVPENKNLHFFNDFQNVIVSPNLAQTFLVNRHPTVYFINDFGTISNVFTPLNEEHINNVFMIEKAV